MNGFEGLFSFNGGPAEDLITIIAADEYPIMITATAVITVFNVTRLFPANNQIIPAIIAKTSNLKLRNRGPTQTPLKKNCCNCKTTVFKSVIRIK